jgi:ribosomal protein S25
MTIFTKAMMTVAALAAAVQVGAAETSVQQTGQRSAAELRDVKESLAWEARKTKGAIQHELLIEELRVQRMIDDLERGRPVAPSEVERAIERAR